MNDRNINSVSKAYLCSSCGACNAICPKDAIIFKESSLGRKYAVSNSNCIQCGLCLKVCPSKDYYSLHERYKDRYVGNILSVEVGRTANDEYYRNGQSGGVCASILSYLFDKNMIDAAVVCQMTFGDLPNVFAKVITSKAEIKQSQKSCYTPVDLLSALKGTTLKKSVAIVGLPCHIQGAVALSLTGKKFSNIKYKIGLICDRALCSGIQSVMKLKSDFCKKNIKIDWRRKHIIQDGTCYTYKNAPVVVYTEDGEEKIMPRSYRLSLKGMFTPPRCRVCYDKLNTHCDIMLGDPWGMSKIDWDKGSSVVVCRTAVGQNVINGMKLECCLDLSERPLEELLKGQQINKRRTDVAINAMILKLLSNGLNSYIFSESAGVRISSAMLKEYRMEIRRFCRRELRTLSSNIKEACILADIASGRCNVFTKVIYKIKQRISL